MPAFRCTIEKYNSLFGEYWVNVYLVNAASMADASTIAGQIALIERPLYTSATTITKAKTNDFSPSTDAFITTIVNLAGTRATTGEPVPLFCTSRVDFGVAGGGRPSRKYLRETIGENEMVSMNLTTALIARLQTYADAIVATSSVADPDNQAFLNGAPWPQVAMRQLRRGSKKGATP